MAASSPASAAAAGGSSVTTIVTETLDKTRVLMKVDGYSKIKETLVDAGSGSIKSERFRARGHSWYMEHRPWDDGGYDDDWVGVHLYLNDPGDDDQVTARYELALLNRDGEIITSIQSFYTFPGKCGDHNSVSMLSELNASPLLGDSFQVRCDLTVVKVAAVTVAPPDLHRHLGGLLGSQVGVDVTFHVGGETFTAHRCVLAARSPVFMAELFGPWKENAAATGTYVRIDDVEPRVFRALLHFIYTDALPEVEEEGDDKVAVAQGLLVAADRYAMERLKLICEDILCIHVDAGTAVTMLELADKHGCYRLMETCIKVLQDMLAKRQLQRVGRVVARGGGWLRGPTSN